MAVDPMNIIEQQLARLQATSDRTSLTVEEVMSLERFVKMQLLMRMKGPKRGLEDPYSDISSEELQRLLPLLSD